ncbi:MAG: hypothetical protein ACPIOQ_01500 [Promethearchaeia archaeon]
MGRAQSCRPQSAESAFRRRMGWRDGAGDGWSGGVTVKAHHRKMFVPGPHGRSHPLHEYATCSLTQEANAEGALGARARWTASYHRIMADQPLPSTAADLAARATSLQGPSLEAAVRRAEVSEQIRSWNLFAAQYEAEHAKNAGQPTPRPRHGTSCASTRRDWNGSNKTMHCNGQLARERRHRPVAPPHVSSAWQTPELASRRPRIAEQEWRRKCRLRLGPGHSCLAPTRLGSAGNS